MHIEITDNTRIGEISNTFANYYPYLKICFFKTPHRKYALSDEAEMLDPARTIGEVRQTHVSALLEIQPWYKVSQVEQEFQNRFGLPVQLFLKVNNQWQQTTGMDDVSLKDLNLLSRNGSDEYILSEMENEDNEE